jgi:hypothetical protein
MVATSKKFRCVIVKASAMLKVLHTRTLRRELLSFFEVVAGGLNVHGVSLPDNDTHCTLWTTSLIEPWNEWEIDVVVVMHSWCRNALSSRS